MISKNTLIIFILLIINNSNATATEAVALATQCTEALRSGQTDKALAAAEAALKQDNSHVDAMLCKGRTLGALGKYADAENTLTQAGKHAKANNDAGVAALLLGNLHKANQQYAKAIASYQQALPLFHPQNNQRYVYLAHLFLGESEALTQDYNAALASYQAANKVANNDNERAESHARIASIYAVLGQYDGAIEQQLKSTMMQKKAGTLDEFAQASLQLGQYYLQAKDYKNATVALNRIREFAKANGGAYYEAKANLLLAQNATAADEPGAAKTYFADAESLAKSVNDKDLNAEIAAFAQTMPK